MSNPDQPTSEQQIREILEIARRKFEAISDEYLRDIIPNEQYHLENREVKQEAADKLKALLLDARIDELQKHIHPHTVWYENLGSIRNTLSVSDRIAALTNQKNRAKGVMHE